MRDASGYDRRILKASAFSVELLRPLRDSQFGRISLAAVMAAGPDGTLHRSDRTVAVKEYDKSLVAAGFGQLSRSQIREDVRAELRLWSRVSQAPRHPNVLPLLGLAQDSARVLAVMEHAALGDCFDYCHAHGFRLGRILARSLCAQAAHAVAFTHSRRVAHRDISLENFVLGRTPSGGPLLQLIDFGLGTDVPQPPGQRLAAPRVRIERSGKVTYMAPEVYCAAPEGGVHDPYAADVWSLGCAFFILATGSQPYDSPVTTFAKPGGERAELAAAQAGRRTIQPRTTFDLIAMGRVVDAMRVCRAPADVVEQLGPLLARMLSMDPASRPSATEVLAHPWVAQAVVPVELQAELGVHATALAQAALSARTGGGLVSPRTVCSPARERLDEETSPGQVHNAARLKASDSSPHMGHPLLETASPASSGARPGGQQQQPHAQEASHLVAAA